MNLGAASSKNDKKGRQVCVRVAGESAVAGLGAAIAAREDAEMSRKLGLDSCSRIFVIGTEGATDPELYQRLISQ